tara:strand:- start:1887 stop:2375 length:489 start_codon:yes stop_codon:yes gene_type:complete
MMFKKLIIYIMRHSCCRWSKKEHLPHRQSTARLSAPIVALIVWIGLPQFAAADQQRTAQLVKCIAKIMDLPIPTTTPHIRYIPQIQIEKIMTAMKSAPHRRGVPVALYIPPQTILMSNAARADDLAHELAHHFQHHNNRPFTSEDAEREAETVRRAAIDQCR